MKTVIFGGTFNPIHLGHLEIIENISKMDDIEKILVIPTGIPPHKECRDLADNNARLEMCKIATSHLKNVVISDIEINRSGKSYTVDTLKKIKKDNPASDICLVCGGDMITTFTQWYKYEEIIKNATIIAVRRVGVDTTEFESAVSGLINMGARITVLKNKITGISSTQIKENINNKEFLYKYLPIGVCKYILDNKLYCGE